MNTILYLVPLSQYLLRKANRVGQFVVEIHPANAAHPPNELRIHEAVLQQRVSNRQLHLRPGAVQKSRLKPPQ